MVRRAGIELTLTSKGLEGLDKAEDGLDALGRAVDRLDPKFDALEREVSQFEKQVAGMGETSRKSNIDLNATRNVLEDLSTSTTGLVLASQGLSQAYGEITSGTQTATEATLSYVQAGASASSGVANLLLLTNSLKEGMTLLNGVVLSGAAGYGVLAAAAVGAGLAIKEIIDLTAELVDVNADAADAAARVTQITDVQQQRYKAILDELELTREEATKYNLTLDRLFELAAKNPHGRIAKAIQAVTQEQVELNHEADELPPIIEEAVQEYTELATSGEAAGNRITAAMKSAAQATAQAAKQTQELAKAAEEAAERAERVRKGTERFQGELETFANIEASRPLGEGGSLRGSEKVEFEEGAQLDAIFDQLDRMFNATIPLGRTYVRAFAEAIQGGDFAALEDVVAVVQRQADFLSDARFTAGTRIGITGGGPLRSLAFGLNQMLGDLQGLIQPRAMGGMVFPGGAFLVGERGPELFTPSGAGMISSNADTVAMQERQLRVQEQQAQAMMALAQSMANRPIQVQLQARDLAIAVNQANERGMGFRV